MKFVIRCRWVDYEIFHETPWLVPEGSPYPLKGVGYLTKSGGVTKKIERGLTAVFETEADAWTFASASGNLGKDEEGDWCWVEPLPEG